MWSICMNLFEYTTTGPGNGLSSGDTKPLTGTNVDIASVGFNNNQMKAFSQAISYISIAKQKRNLRIAYLGCLKCPRRQS